MNRRRIFNLDYLISLLIVFVGGFIELYSIKTRGIYAAMQTGNLLSIFSSLIDGEGTLAIKYLCVFLSFVIGLVLGEVTRLVFSKTKELYPVCILSLEIIAVIPLFFLPYSAELESFDKDAVLSLVGDCLLSVHGALHLICFHEVNGHSYTPTMMTNMTKLFITSLVSSIKEKDKEKGILSLSYFVQIVMFIVGALFFYLVYAIIPEESLSTYIRIVPISIVVVSIICLALFLVKGRKNDKEAVEA